MSMYTWTHVTFIRESTPRFHQSSFPWKDCLSDSTYNIKAVRVESWIIYKYVCCHLETSLKTPMNPCVLNAHISVCRQPTISRNLSQSGSWGQSMVISGQSQESHPMVLPSDFRNKALVWGLLGSRGALHLECILCDSALKAAWMTMESENIIIQHSQLDILITSILLKSRTSVGIKFW